MGLGEKIASQLETAVTAKDNEISELRRQLAASTTTERPPAARRSVLSVLAPEFVPHTPEHNTTSGHELDEEPRPLVGTKGPRRAKAPPVDSFSGEDERMRFEEWLPALVRASTWNRWSEEDLLIQLAGHLRGRALQEWNLIPAVNKTTYAKALSTLQERLDPGGKLLAVQDFRHASQREEESMAEFLRRLERCFQVAYGRDGLGEETRNTLLYSQMQKGLKIELMRAAAVSGAGSYQALCLAAKNEERRLAELGSTGRLPHLQPHPVLVLALARKPRARAMIRDTPINRG